MFKTMKRRREMEKSKTEMRSAIEELSTVVKIKTPSSSAMDIPNIDDDSSSIQHHHHHHHHDQIITTIQTKPVISLCSLLLQVLDKIGPTMTVIRQDIHRNIQRLETVYESEPSRFASIDELLKMEAQEGIAKKTASCSRALVWLTRSMDFTAALLRRLAMEPGVSMEHAVEDAYAVALKPCHGWISSAAFRVATKLIPDNKTFMELLGAKEQSRESLVEEMQTLVSFLQPFLEEIHTLLNSYNLEKLKST